MDAFRKYMDAKASLIHLSCTLRDLGIRNRHCDAYEVRAYIRRWVV